MKRILPVFLLAVAFAACKDGSGSGPRLRSLTLSPEDAFTSVGDTAVLTVTATGESGGAVNPDVDFRSLNPAVARVDGEGVITGVAVGSTQVIGEGGGAADTVDVTVFAQGTLLRLNTNADVDCTAPDIRKGRVVANSQFLQIVEDVQNPAGGFTQAEYQAIGARFDNLNYPVNVANFGAPTDIDNNGRIIVFYTRAVNEMTPRGAGFFVGGFFFGRDLFPKTETPRAGACPASNVAEIFYVLAPDPNGEVNGNRRTTAFVREQTMSTLSHEFEHLINASRRLYVNTNTRVFEGVWLDEGLAHIAEELAFYAFGGLAPRQNLQQSTLFDTQPHVDAYNEYARANFGRLRTYLQSTENQSPLGETVRDDDLETRGAAWSFLRYSADRRAGNDAQYWFALVNNPDSGVINLRSVLGTDPSPWFRDWTVANYADDGVAGVEARFTHPSYNFRNLYAHPQVAGAYPLLVKNLVDGQTVTTSIQALSAGYYRFGVAAGGTATLRVTASGTGDASACANVALAVGQVYQGGPEVPALCFSGGAAGAEFVLVPFNASQTTGSNLGISIVATGIVPVVGPPSPSLAPSSLVAGLERADASLFNDGGFHMRLRYRERELAEELLGGGGGTRLRPMSQVAAAPAPADIRIQVLRTK